MASNIWELVREPSSGLVLGSWKLRHDTDISGVIGVVTFEKGLSVKAYSSHQLLRIVAAMGSSLTLVPDDDAARAVVASKMGVEPVAAVTVAAATTVDAPIVAPVVNEPSQVTAEAGTDTGTPAETSADAASVDDVPAKTDATPATQAPTAEQAQSTQAEAPAVAPVAPPTTAPAAAPEASERAELERRFESVSGMKPNPKWTDAKLRKLIADEQAHKTNAR